MPQGRGMGCVGGLQSGFRLPIAVFREKDVVLVGGGRESFGLLIPMISRASEYAIRALTFLSQQEKEGGFYLARDMAHKLGVPAPFLAKILQPLVTRGLIKSQRGRSGGFKLADGKKPADISLYDIVDAEEHLGKIRQCLLGQAECSDERACPLHRYWKRTSDEYLALLASTTLRELTHFCETKPQSAYPCPTPPA